LTDFNNLWYVKSWWKYFDMNTLQICPRHLSDVAILPWEIQKSHILTLLFIYFELSTLSQNKTNSNCCTAALAVYLLLFNASCYLHSPSTASEARYRRSACWGRVEACGSGLLRRGLNFSTAWCTTRLNSVEKRLEACRRWSLWTLAVTLLAWHFSCHTSQPVLFRAIDDNWQLALFRTSNVGKNTTNVRWKSFAIYKLVWWQFLGGVGKWITDFLWDHTLAR